MNIYAEGGGISSLPPADRVAGDFPSGEALTPLPPEITVECHYKVESIGMVEATVRIPICEEDKASDLVQVIRATIKSLAEVPGLVSYETAVAGQRVDRASGAQTVTLPVLGGGQ